MYSWFPDRTDLRNIQRSLHSLTPEISDEDEDPYAVESMVVHGVLDAGLISCSSFMYYSARFCLINTSSADILQYPCHG